MTEDYREAAPVDSSVEAFGARGLTVSVVAQADEARFGDWLQVVARGFLDGEPTADEIAASRERSDHRRMIGIYDADAVDPGRPVATVASWESELSLPGSATVPVWAISAVTVAPTHRRRGVARAMLEGELAFAAGRGIPIAALTVSEATLYGRYGFAPAVSVTEIAIDTKRVRWIGPVPEGRIDFVSRERFRELAPAMHERVRPGMAGEVVIPSAHWDTFARVRPDAKEPGKIRAIQFRDVAGEVRGLAIYSVKENHDDFTKARVDIVYLLAETDDAYSAMWRFFVELDLVGDLHAHEQPLDAPVLWMLSDQRGAKVEVRDHHYVRILDVERVLGARRYAAGGVFHLDVADPLGHATGTYLLRIDADGAAEIARHDAEVPAEAIPVALGVYELSAIVLGGVSPAALAVAGRITTTDAAALSRAFGWHTAPRLSFWY
jgi:predicted acetyltransferase